MDGVGVERATRRAAGRASSRIRTAACIESGGEDIDGVGSRMSWRAGSSIASTRQQVMRQARPPRGRSAQDLPRRQDVIALQGRRTETGHSVEEVVLVIIGGGGT